MEKLVKKIIKFAEDNEYQIIVNDNDNPDFEIEVIVIDNTQATIYVGPKKDYLSNPNMED